MMVKGGKGAKREKGKKNVCNGRVVIRSLMKFTRIGQYGVSSVVITGANGVALGNISMTDIKVKCANKKAG